MSKKFSKRLVLCVMISIVCTNQFAQAFPDLPDFEGIKKTLASNFENTSKAFTPAISHQIQQHVHHPYLVGGIFIGALNANNPLLAWGLTIVTGGALGLKGTNHLLRRYVHQESDLTSAPSLGTVMLGGTTLTAYLLARQIDHAENKVTFPTRPDLVSLVKHGFFSKESTKLWLNYWKQTPVLKRGVIISSFSLFLNQMLDIE